MLVKSHNHSHFWTENKIVYESYNTFRGLRFMQVAELWFFYPNHQKLTQPMIDYLNRRFANKPEIIEETIQDPVQPIENQFSLF